MSARFCGQKQWFTSDQLVMLTRPLTIRRAHTPEEQTTWGIVRRLILLRLEYGFFSSLSLLAIVLCIWPK
ncbi:hypothetical protein C8Q74DRAFT_1441440, partial [Fomes fomentarius]